MRVIRPIAMIALLAGFFAGPALSQTASPEPLGENAALRYWSAFAEMQDSAMMSHKIPGLDDPRVKELFDKNRAALDTMQRGTMLPKCDWGIDYQLGANAPVEYVRKALLLGNLNALYVMYLEAHGDTEGAVRALVAGLRFSHDVANDGTLFATEAADQLLMDHLPMIANIVHAGVSPAQRSALQKVLAQLGPAGLDWQGAVKRELGLYQGTDHGLSAQGLAALSQITPLYVDAMSDSSVLPRLQNMIANAPTGLRNFMPNPERVVEAEQSLQNHLAEARGLLQ
ncbi:MAG TPA: hypothetical protein VGU63_13910 [Candidatus Acidoferrales bacterium]|nr:hypothetical protein [Candidatus Acidoferrales bacterium]